MVTLGDAEEVAPHPLVSTGCVLGVILLIFFISISEVQQESFLS